jgi:hypothetical protein
VVNDPVFDDASQRLALIQRLWNDLQAARNDTKRYEALAERLRREAYAFRQTLDLNKPNP